MASFMHKESPRVYTENPSLITFISSRREKRQRVI